MTSILGRGEIDRSQTWIVGHDGSAGAELAIRWALTQGRGRPATIELVHVCPTASSLIPSSTGSIADDAPSPIRADLDALVARFESAGITAHTKVVAGVASQRLLEASADAALLVVGTRGRGGFNRLLLGSVSHQCAAYTHTPIVVVPSAALADAPVGKVVVGVDGSERSLAALRWALAFAPQDASFEVVGAWIESRMGSIAMMQDLSSEGLYTRRAFHDLLDALDPALVGGRDVERRFVHEHPKPALVDASTGADLLVVGQRGHSGLSAVILGSVATHVLHHSHAPVAVIPGERRSIPLGVTTEERS